MGNYGIIGNFVVAPGDAAFQFVVTNKQSPLVVSGKFSNPGGAFGSGCVGAQIACNLQAMGSASNTACWGMDLEPTISSDSTYSGTDLDLYGLICAPQSYSPVGVHQSHVGGGAF
jgi:hypothetical protein